VNIKNRLKLAAQLTVENLKHRLQKHSDRALQIPWNFAQLGVLIFPSIPILGALGLFLALASTCKQKFSEISSRPINRGFAALSALLILAAVFARNSTEAFLGLGNFLPFFIFFAAFSRLIQTPAQLRQLSWLLVISSIPVIILGLGQQFLGWNSLVQLQPVLGWVLEPKGNPPGRMASVFMYANILACYLTIVFVLALGLWIESVSCQLPVVSSQSSVVSKKGKGRRKREKGTEEKEIINELPINNYPLTTDNCQLPITNYRFLFLSFAVAGNAVCLIFTNSRNAWGIAVIAVLAFAIYAGWKTLVTGVFGAAGTILLSAFGPDPLRQYLRRIVPALFWLRLTDARFPNRPVATLRTTQWQFAWSMTQQRPWTGWGLRNFTPLYEAQMHEWLGHPHSLILMLTAETGIPTTLFFMGLVGWILAKGVLLLVNWPPLSPVDIDRDKIGTREIKENAFLSNQTSISCSTNPVICQEIKSDDRPIFFSYLLAFGACTLFNTVDVTLFDLRVNTISWLLLAAICGACDFSVPLQGKEAQHRKTSL